MSDVPEPSALRGQQDAVRSLESALRGGRVPGAYLFHGPAGVGRSIAATMFAAALLCEKRDGLRRCGACRACRWNAAGTHPDFLFVTADRGPRFDDDAAAERAPQQEFLRAARDGADRAPRKTIPVRTLRRMMEILSLTAAGGGWKAVVIDAFDDIEEEGAAALLKTLEEAPPKTTFLLLARATDGVPDTILSRCQRVRFRPLANDVVTSIVDTAGGAKLDAASMDLVVRVAQGSAGRALRAIATGLSGDAAAAARALVHGDDEGIDPAIAWVKAGGRDLESQRERARELAALLMLLLRDSWSGAVSEARFAAVRGCLESIDSNVSPDLALKALGVRFGRSRALTS